MLQCLILKKSSGDLEDYHTYDIQSQSRNSPTEDGEKGGKRGGCSPSISEILFSVSFSITFCPYVISATWAIFSASVGEKCKTFIYHRIAPQGSSVISNAEISKKNNAPWKFIHPLGTTFAARTACEGLLTSLGLLEGRTRFVNQPPLTKVGLLFQ